MTFAIKHKDGSVVASVNSLTYSDKRMGEEFVSLTIYAANPIDWQIGDYITYRGSEFYLNTLPTMKRKSSNGSVGDAICYDGVKFSSARLELTDCTFLDVVKGDNNIHTALPDFSFYASSVRELGDRLEKNLSRLGKGWSVTYGTLTGAKSDITVTVNNLNCWDALALAKSEFNVNFSISGRTITIGDVVNELNSQALEYGKGKGLVTIERTADDSQQVITRLRAYGNSTNMPTRFYANRGVTCTLPVLNKVDYKMEWVDGIKKDEDYNAIKNAGMILDEIMPFIQTKLVRTAGCIFTTRIKNDLKPSSFNTYDPKKYSAIIVDTSGRTIVVWISGSTISFAVEGIKAADLPSSFYFSRGINKDTWPASYKQNSQHVPNNLHIDRLMLPSFPSVQYPYLEKNVAKYGVREATVYFDGSDDRKDIFPTIENVDVSVSRGSGITDNGSFGTDTTEEVVPPFTIDITFGSGVNSEFVFNPWDYRVAGDKPKISMKSGPCCGREFEIIKCEKTSERTYTLTCNREEDTGLRLYFPYSAYNINSGNKFVLLGVSMPESYVDAAARVLEQEANAYLDANCEMRYKYAIKMSSIYAHNGRNWHDTICAGQLVSFYDRDVVGESSVVYPIDSIEIKEGEALLPSYNIVLSDEPAVGTITRVQNSVEAVRQSAITQVYPLTIRREGELIGIYNPSEKGLTLELGAKGSGEEGGMKECDASKCAITLDITAGKAVGYIDANTKFPKGTSIEEIIKRLLVDTKTPVPAVGNKPTVSMTVAQKVEYMSDRESIAISITLNDSTGVDGLATLTIKKPDGTTETFSVDLSSGSATVNLTGLWDQIGEYSYTLTVPYKGNTEKKLDAGTLTKTGSTVVFVYSYIGVFKEDGKSTFTVDEIRGLQAVGNGSHTFKIEKSKSPDGSDAYHVFVFATSSTTSFRNIFDKITNEANNDEKDSWCSDIEAGGFRFTKIFTLSGMTTKDGKNPIGKDYTIYAVYAEGGFGDVNISYHL